MNDNIQQNIANTVGNFTESQATSAIYSSPLGEIPFVGPALERSAINQAKKVSAKINQQISGFGKKKGGGGGSGSSPGPAPFGNMEPPEVPSGGRFTKPSQSNGYYTQERMATNPEPYQYELNTGIRAPVYSPLYQDSNTNGNISMRMVSNSIRYQIDNFQVSEFFKTVILSVFSNSVQRAVSYNAGGIVTSATLSSYMNSLIDGLNAYFFVKSILAYTDSPLNRCDAMVNLRSTITANDFTGLYSLERILLQTPIPPNLINLLWWMNGVYSDGTLPNCTINKFVTFTGAKYSSADGSFEHNINWSALISSIQGNVQIINLISRAVPSWVRASLPSYVSAPVYDSGWLTLFANSPLHCRDNVNVTPLRVPSLPTPTASWYYSSFTNELDGAILALTTAWDEVNAKFLPNLASPIVMYDDAVPAEFTNRLFWVGSAWRSSSYSDSDANVQVSLYTYVTTRGTGTYRTSFVPGTEPILGVNISSVTQASIQLAEWLFNIDAIGYIEDRRVYDTNSSNKIGRSNGKRRR